MKKVFEKVSYMAVGSLLTLLGYHFGNMDNTTANAQVTIERYGAGAIEDVLLCRSLVIHGDDNTPRIRLGTDIYDCGEIEIFNEKGERRILLHISQDFRRDVDGGALELSGKGTGSVAAILSVNANGGYLGLHNKRIVHPVIEASVSTDGEGVILTKDRVGSQTGFVGSPRNHTTIEMFRK